MDNKILFEKFSRYAKLAQIAGESQYVPGCPDLTVNNTVYTCVSRFADKDQAEATMWLKKGFPGRYALGFQGSVEEIDWITDARFIQTPWPWSVRLKKMNLWCHRGFAAYYSEVRKTIIQKICEILAECKAQGIKPHFTIYGHSEGCGVQKNCLIDLIDFFGNQIDFSGYGFGRPPCLNTPAQQFLNDNCLFNYEIKHADDIVYNLRLLNYYYEDSPWHFYKNGFVNQFSDWKIALEPWSNIPDHLIINYINSIEKARTLI